jgi:hypothetical protein
MINCRSEVLGNPLVVFILFYVHFLAFSFAVLEPYLAQRIWPLRFDFVQCLRISVKEMCLLVTQKLMNPAFSV